MKTRIYTRVFCIFITIFLLLMGAFTLYYVDLHKHMEAKSFVEKAKLTSQYTNSFYEDYTAYINGEENITAEEINNAVVYAMFYDMDFAIYEGSGELVWSNSFDKWYCSYEVATGPNEQTHITGLIDPEKHFTEDEIKEIEGYMSYSEPDADMWEVCDYYITVEGLWTDGFDIIPESLTVNEMKVTGKDNEGIITSKRGDPIKKINVDVDEEGLDADYKYYEYGTLEYMKTEALTTYVNGNSFEKASEYVNSKEIFDKVLDHTMSMENDIIYNEREGFLSYMFVYDIPYDGVWDFTEDAVYPSETITIFAGVIDLWELYGKELMLIILGCLAVFIAAAWITASQSYKIYLAREKNEENRIKITNALAHDLKTPLAAISGYSDLIAEDLNADKRDHYSEMIKENVNIMDGALKQMLELSRIESLGIKLNKTEFGLAELTEEVVKRFEVNALLRGVKVEIDGDQLMTADRAMIKSAIDNLISNAVRHSEEKGTIEIRITEKNWSVFNRGKNIPEEEMDKIWDPYYKSDHSRSGSEGTGLGLYIVKNVMDIHGLGYGVENKGDGVRFTFEIKK
ncbi:MAG: HAMP domain-containing histidine kinase [Firmicutes bacterium]|nr:HAMP domain-containing histidine kinase [Bacillota bacterium]